MDSADNHFEIGFAGLYANNVQRKLLVCIYAVKAKTSAGLGRARAFRKINNHIETGFAGLFIYANNL